MNSDILLLTEPYYQGKVLRLYAPGWDSICKLRCAILVRRDIVHASQTLQHPDVVSTRIGNTDVVCAYSSPNEDNTGILLFLHQLVSGNSRKVIIGGDFNCSTSLIPSYHTHDQGIEFEMLILQTELEILNNSQSTWHRGNKRSIIDYILTREVSAHSYSILHDDSHSDHFFLSFQVEHEDPSVHPYSTLTQ